MGMYLGNSKISFSIGTLSQVSEERIVSQMSAAIAQVVDKVNEEVLPFHFYTEDEWDKLTKYDTTYDSVPSGMIYIYDDQLNEGPGEQTQFDELCAIIQLPADSSYDAETGMLTLGSSFSLEDEILIEHNT